MSHKHLVSLQYLLTNQHYQFSLFHWKLQAMCSPSVVCVASCVPKYKQRWRQKDDNVRLTVSYQKCPYRHQIVWEFQKMTEKCLCDNGLYISCHCWLPFPCVSSRGSCIYLLFFASFLMKTISFSKLRQCWMKFLLKLGRPNDRPNDKTFFFSVSFLDNKSITDLLISTLCCVDMAKAFSYFF